MKKIFLALTLLTAVVSCSSSKKIVDVRSPCVSLEDGPCGPKKPVNDWWLNKTNVKI